MKTITKIEVQKRNPKRRSIYVDDVFVAGVDAEVAAELDLHEGQAIDDDTLQRALLAEERRRATDSAYRYLARRAHSAHELKVKLRRRGFPQAIVDEVIDGLRQRGYVDDLEFARSYVRNRMATSPVGEMALRAELRKRGVGGSEIDAAVGEVLSEHDPVKVASEIARKRLRAYGDLDAGKARQRVANFLLRRGFSYEIVGEALREVMQGTEPSDA